MPRLDVAVGCGALRLRAATSEQSRVHLEVLTRAARAPLRAVQGELTCDTSHVIEHTCVTFITWEKLG